MNAECGLRIAECGTFDAFPAHSPFTIHQSAYRRYPPARVIAVHGFFAYRKRMPYLKPELYRLLTFLSVTGLFFAGAAFADEPKKEVHSQADLPRATYPVTGSVSSLLQSDDSVFSSIVGQAAVDLDTLLSDYDIKDNATLISILSAKLSLQELKGDAADGIQTIRRIRELQSKPDLKLTFGLFDEAILKAQESGVAKKGAEYEQKVESIYQDAVNALPWDVVQDVIKSARSISGLLSESFLLGDAQEKLQPEIDKAGSLSRESIYALMNTRSNLRIKLPVNSIRVNVLKAYVAAHDTQKPDIWAARDVTLSSEDHPAKVLVGIWDSGFDPAVYPGHLYSYPNSAPYPAQGLAFTDDGKPSDSALYPLTPEQKQQYPEISEDLEALSDLKAGVETPVTESFKKRLSQMSKDDVHTMLERLSFFGNMSHGTHVAGIAIKGNPAAQLVVFRFNDGLSRELHFPPSTEWANRMAANFKRIGQFCAEHKVRVVNLSWGDDPREFEEWLSRTKGNQTADERKQEALELFSIWKQAIINAMNAAPDTLFVTAAGNADSDAGFLEDIPSSLELPNLITVGATNQAGDATSFTSYGKTVVVYASGYHVESFIPAGKKVKFSGTSMAAPQVTNLAAKLFATDPLLTADKVKELIISGSTPSEDGKRKLLDEKRSLQLIKQKATAKANR
jgi:subtilisin family serine protease